jgi:hypothetical protein
MKRRGIDLEVISATALDNYVAKYLDFVPYESFCILAHDTV